MIFDEKFIDHNIAELCENYDKIRGANVNIARISPDLIDGLKPVQRRALYVMYLKDKGRTFRKLATIAGEVFGRVHPHAPTAVESALVGLEQEWHNSIPLIDGEGNFGSCHDVETQVLTQAGWKYFKDITMNDELASVNPEDGTMIFEKPTNITKYHYTGNLIRGLHKSLDFAVTPNHKMVISKYNKRKREFESYNFIDACELPNYSGLINKFYHKGNKNELPIILRAEVIVNGNVLPEVEIPMDIWVQFLGIYLADGYMTIEDPNDYPYKKIHLCAVTKDRKKKYYSEILKGMGINKEWSESVKGFDIFNKRIWEKLESYGLFGKKSYEKFIPDFIFKLDYSYIEKFLYAFYMGDGSRSGWHGSTSYWTSSETMAHQLQILSLMSGKFCTFYRRKPRTVNLSDGRTIQSIRDQFEVYAWSNKNQSIDKSKHISEIPYDGMVYCAEVPTYHTLITKRNERILLSGNCAGDPSGASRYIKARLSDYAYACFFEDWKDAVVDMVMAYDEETKEPLFLPAKYPNVLLNGCLGIGFGLASNVPPYNFREVVEACIQLMVDPDANIVLIPDSPTGADIIETDFAKLSDRGNGTYSMRCTYEVDDKLNQITITSLPYQITVNTIREKIADIKERGAMSELIAMNDMSGKAVDLRLIIRDDVNPYKFMKKLIKEVGGLEKSYPVNITVTNDYEMFDLSVKQLLVEWIKYRREQKRVVISHKRTTLLAEQRTNDVKIFLMNKSNLEDTIKIFRSSRNRLEIEQRLIETYKHSEIRMDSLQAKVLSNLRMHELSIDSYEACIKRRSELEKELEEVSKILDQENGIDKIIIAELRDGIKRFGSPRRSNVIPYKITVGSDIEGACTVQLSSDGIVLRREATNVYEEPIPADTNGFAVRVDNDAAFIIIDDNGFYSYVKVREIPLDTEVPINRFMKVNLNGNIIAMLPVDINSDLCCTLISKNGQLKKIRISDMTSSKKPCMMLDKDDKIIRGLVTKARSIKDILVYTKDGMGQRVDPNHLRITSPSAKGGNGFKLKGDDEIVGCYTINPEENQYLFYMTMKGKARLNLIDYLPTRDSKHDSMVRLISLNDRDRLVSVIGCNKLDKVQVFFDDGDNETIDINSIEEGTMSSEPKKVTSKNAVSTNVLKVRLL